MIVLKLGFLFWIFIIQSNAIQIDGNGYKGCFKNDIFNHEFNSFASHLDSSIITPQRCISACTVMGYSLAAIENGNLCFCKSGTNINSVKALDSNCETIPCEGNPNSACGSMQHIMVYEAGSFVKLNSVNLVNKPTIVELFQPITFQVDFTGYPKNLYLSDNHAMVGNYDMLNSIRNEDNFTYYVTNNDDDYLEFIISPFGIYSDRADSIGLKLPNVLDLLDEPILNCPDYSLDINLITCDLLVKNGSNLKASINYGDGQSTNIDLINFDTINFGNRVPKALKTYSNFQMTTNEYLIANSEILTHGYLRAIELYSQANTAALTIKVVRLSTCLSSTNQDFRACANDPQKVATFDCSPNNYKKSKFSCSSIDRTQRFDSFVSTTAFSYTEVFSRTFNIKTGYNLLTNFNNLEVKPGYVIIIQNSPTGLLIDLDTSDIAFSDFEIVSSNLIKVNGSFRMNAIVSPTSKTLGIGYKYTGQNNYSLSVTVFNTLNPSNTYSLNKNIMIYETVKIGSLSSSTGGIVCYKDKPCTIIASIITGKDLEYYWTVEGNLLNTTINQVTYIFKTVGKPLITLTALNFVSNETRTFQFQVTDRLEGLSFKSGTATVSASASNKPASFLFTLQAGANYECLINYGSSSTTFTDLVYNLNNTYFNHTYPNREAVYTVTISCKNEVNSITNSFPHYVQHEITGLKLSSNATFVNTPYSIEFTINTGSNPIDSTLLVDNIPDTVNFNNFIGKGILRNGESLSRIVNISITLRNYVSFLQLNTFFEVASPIINPNFEITPSGNLAENTYTFGTSIIFVITMDSGANVRIDLNTDFNNENLLTNNKIGILLPGEWTRNSNEAPNKYKINYLYDNPGDYLIRLELSNALGRFFLTKQISLISTVDGLLPGLIDLNPNNYVLFESSDGVNGKGLAEFVFMYSGITKSGSHSLVRFWPGDMNNATYGPFKLGMDFNENISKTSLQYEYLKSGIYNVIFEVSNIRGSKIFNLNVQVVKSIFGFYIDVNPKVQVVYGSVKIATYMIQGDNVVYTFKINGNIIHNMSRKATSYELGDSVDYTVGPDGKYIIEVEAKDNYFTKVRNYELNVQSGISSFGLSYTPINSINDDQNPDSRTFTFTLTMPINDPSANYIIDFGDNSIIDFPKPIGLGVIESHVYSSSGIYNVNVTVFNPVSTLSQFRIVEIFSNFIGFKCTPFWRPFESPNTIEYEYKLTGDSYIIKNDYDLRLQCTWLRLDATPTEIQLELNGIVKRVLNNFTSLDKLRTSDRIGYTIPFSKLDFPSPSQKMPIRVRIMNNMFRDMFFDLNITTYSSLKNLVLIKPETVIQMNIQHPIEVQFESLGTPSCSLVKYTNSKGIVYNLGKYGDSSQCSILFPSVNYIQPYSIISSNWIINSKFMTTGNLRLTIEIKNSFESLILNTNITVVSTIGLCELPKISLEKSTQLFYKPEVFKITDLISIVSNTQVNCSKSSDNLKEWLIYKVDKKTGAVGSQIKLLNNPTINYAELVIQPKTLNYGLYKIVYSVTMLYNSIYTNQIETFIEIIPAGIIISVFEGQFGDGIYETSRGTNQEFTLNPVAYSIDLENRIKMDSLKFKYYCRLIEKEIEQDYARLGLNSLIDLLTIKTSTNVEITNLVLNNSLSCFKSLDNFKFDTSGNILTINRKGLEFVKDRKYEFLITTEFTEYEFDAKIRVEILNYNYVPVINLRCKFFETCWPVDDGVKINPSTQLILTSTCTDGCLLSNNVTTLEYSYNVYKYWSISPDNNDIEEKWVPFYNTSNLRNFDSKELTIENNLFNENPQTKFWKFELTLKTISLTSGIAVGKASLIVKINEIPKSGSCDIDNSRGIPFETIFTITCKNWIDPDGKIKKYSFFAVYLNDPVKIGLGSSINGKLSTQLPQGAIYDSNQLKIEIQIYDEEDGFAFYTIPTNVTVNFNKTISDPSSLITPQLINNLNNGDSKTSMQTILGLASILNSFSLSDKASLNNIENRTTILTTSNGPLSSYSGVASSNIDESQYETNRNERANMRDFIGNYINNLSISDISSIKFQSSMLKELTAQTDEITRNLGDVVTNQCIRLALGLKTISGKTAIEDIKQSVYAITNTLGNTLTGLSTYLNDRGTTLKRDYDRAIALPDYYDTNLENFWTQPKNFRGDDGTETSQEKMDKNMNIQRQKFQVVDNAQKVTSITDLVTNIVSSHFPVGEELQVQTPNMGLKIQKLKAKDLKSEINIDNAKINLPNFCELENSKQTPTSSGAYNPADEFNCTNKIITVQGTSLSTPPSGHNGMNETKIGLSTSLGLSFFNENGVEIKITKSKKNLDLWIPRDKNLPDYPFQWVNVSNQTMPKSSQILPNSFDIQTNNASMHIEIQPDVIDINKIGYLVLVKFGHSPQMNSTYKNYNYWKLLCPQDHLNHYLNGTQIPYFNFFLNTSQVNGHRGFAGFGLRQLTKSEIDSYCSNLTSLKEPPFMPPNETTLFQNDFSIRVYTSGCYYFDKYTGKWRSDGMEILADTNFSSAHCQSNHLTSFAGGFIVLPAKVNFTYVFANAGFLENPVIYSTVICLLALYILIGLWAYINDRRDKKRVGITVLEDRFSSDNYFYEIIVFTGNRSNASTDSKVSLILNGDNYETNPREMIDKKRKLYRRGGIDSFVLGCPKPLGNLNYLRVWHDNSGKGAHASWYLKFIIVHDLQTREKFYFLCEKWLALEKSDGLIDRILPVAGEKQKTEVKYLMKKQAKQNIRDGHLWFSVFARPALSSFSRLDRITCCFVLLSITMLMNILYYETGSSTSSGGLSIGPFKLTTEQIGIGIVTNFITFPPCFLLVQLFRRSKSRSIKSTQLRNILKEKSQKMERSYTNYGLTDLNSEQPEQREETEVNEDSTKSNKYKVKSKKKKLLFPWWMKIFAYILSFLFAFLSLFFTVIKGIEFGDEKVKKWLSSLAISFLTSIFLTQPIQVLLVALFFVLICRKYDESQDSQTDSDDNGESLNDMYTYSKFKYSSDEKIEKFGMSSDVIILKASELQAAREQRLREVKIWDAIREIVIYFIFLCVLFTVCYTNNGNSSYGYQAMIKKVFEPSITTIDDFWKWSMDSLAVNLRAGRWYNGSQPYGLAGFLNDKISRMLGYATFRQVRVKNNSCIANNKFNESIYFCNEDLNLFNEEKLPYGFNWNTYNESFVPEHGMNEIYKAYQYRDSSSLKTIPLFGKYNTYMGGGYVYELRDRLQFLRGNLSLLQQMNWIDRQTRAVIVEFSVYNPGLNIIMVSYILIEVLPSGNLLTMARFDPLNLFNEITSNSYILKLVFDAIYMLFIIFFMIKQIIILWKTGFIKYFKQFWNYIEWLIIIFSWSAFAIFLYRLNEANEVLDFFKKTQGYGYLNLQRINSWNQLLSIFMGLCAALGTLKFLKLFRFNNKIYSIATTLKYSIKHLLGFSLVFLLIWLAFVQLMYLIFFERLFAYYTIFRSAMTSFQIMLGKFDSSSLLRDGTLFGPLVFSFYNIMIVLILLNIFISIVCDAFEKVREEIQINNNELEIVDYFMEKFENVFSSSTSKTKDGTIKKDNEYFEGHRQLPTRISNLLTVISDNVDQSDFFMNSPEPKKYI